MKFLRVLVVVALSVVTVTGCGLTQPSAQPGQMMSGQDRHRQFSMMDGQTRHGQFAMMRGSMVRDSLMWDSMMRGLRDRDDLRPGPRRDFERCPMFQR
jgi:hypothetical protein